MKQFKKSSMFAGAAVIALASMASAVAYAKDEVVVTARKKEESLKDVPISLNVVAGADIENQGLRDLQTVIETVPAVNLSKGGAGAFINIRGVGSGENPGFEQSVGYVLDGVSLGRSRATRAGLLDIERVEVLKGPQTTYFGANTIAGVINVTSRSPDLDGGLSGYLRSSYEFETDEKVIEGAVNLPLHDAFAVRLAAKYSDAEGYIQNNGLDRREPAIEDTIFRATALWEPTDSFNAQVKYTYAELEANSGLDIEFLNCTPFDGMGAGGVAQFNCLDPDGVPVDDELNYVRDTDLTDEFRKLDLDVVNATLNYDIGDFTLTSVTGFYQFESEFQLDLDNTTVPSLAGPESRFYNNQLDTAEHWSQEIRIASPTDGPFSWLLGGYFQDEDIRFSNTAIAAFTPPAPVSMTNPGIQSATSRQEATTYSVFGTATYEITDRLIGTVGLRYINVEKEVEQTPTTPGIISADFDPSTVNFAPVAPFRFEFDSLSDDDILPSVDLTYAVTDSTNVYFTFGQGFKAGGYSLANPPNDPGDFFTATDYIQQFEPESVNAYEVGVKGDFFDGMLSANLAIFRSKFKDRQVSSLAESSAGGSALSQAVANAATSRSQGVELDFTARLMDRLTVIGAFTYLDSKYLDFANAPCYTGQTVALGCIELAGGDPMDPTDNVQDLSDRETTFAPEYAGTVTVRYEHPIGDYLVSIEPNVQFTDGYFFVQDFNPLNKQESFTKLNVRAGFGPEDGQWELAFVGRNLTDKITSHFCQEPPAAGAGSIACSPDRPATYQIQGKINF
ncbi:MAG: TonB-dependent receptor [Pseudomonadota bacterium]